MCFCGDGAPAVRPSESGCKGSVEAELRRAHWFGTVHLAGPHARPRDILCGRNNPAHEREIIFAGGMCSDQDKGQLWTIRTVEGKVVECYLMTWTRSARFVARVCTEYVR